MGAGDGIAIVWCLGIVTLLGVGLWKYDRKRRAQIPIIVRMGEPVSNNSGAKNYAAAPGFKEFAATLAGAKKKELRQKLKTHIDENPSKLVKKANELIYQLQQAALDR